MVNKIALRESPQLSFKFNENDVEIVDVQEEENSGVHLYRNIQSYEFKKEALDWLVSITSFLIGNGGNYKNQPHLKLFLGDKTLKIWLNGMDSKKIESLKAKFKDVLKHKKQLL